MFQAIYALNNGEVYRAYELYLSAGLYNLAHDLAVLELAPDAVIHRDLDLLKELFERFVGHQVDDWHTRGKVRFSNLPMSIFVPHHGARLACRYSWTTCTR